MWDHVVVLLDGNQISTPIKLSHGDSLDLMAQTNHSGSTRHADDDHFDRPGRGWARSWNPCTILTVFNIFLDRESERANPVKISPLGHSWDPIHVSLCPFFFI